MTNFGNVLKEKREELGYSIQEVSDKIKIKSEYVQSIEEGKLDIGLSEVYLKGFIRSYANFLNLDQDKIMAMYRRDKNIEEEQEGRLQNKQNVLNRTKFILTPRLAVGLSSIIIILSLGVFLGYQVYNVLSCPELVLEIPRNIVLRPKIGSQTEEVKILTEKNDMEITGKTESDALLYINGEQYKLEDNTFKKDVRLLDGSNTIEVKVDNGFDKYSLIILEVDYNPDN